MKRIIITQRIDEIKHYREIRDALDQKWYQFFDDMNSVLFPMPNYSAFVPEIIEAVQPRAIVLSGGCTPVAYGGEFPMRDNTDERLIEYAIRNHIPLLGVCRGMQSVALYFGAKLEKVENHIGVRHQIHGKECREVNSYHGYEVTELPEEMEILASAEDGVIESLCHKKYKVYGIMWHPERVDGFDMDDKKMISEMLEL